MKNWISALTHLSNRNEPCVVVTILEELGSTPRNAGTKMVVTRERCYDTIGGGNLEYQATAKAREMLAEGCHELRVERLVLGASLGQCCGGAVVLLLEPVVPNELHIALFGAGHVGRALAPILATLPCRVRWIDSREQEFPEQMPPGVKQVVTDSPVDEVDRMPPGSYYIVMTHDHPLDFALSERILERNNFGYFGLIGSRSKRVSFERRLRAQGISESRLGRMTCPLGLPMVKGKRPAEIAVAVAGEVIAHYNADFGSEHQKSQQRDNHELLKQLP